MTKEEIQNELQNCSRMIEYLTSCHERALRIQEAISRSHLMYISMIDKYLVKMENIKDIVEKTNSDNK